MRGQTIGQAIHHQRHVIEQLCIVRPRSGRWAIAIGMWEAEQWDGDHWRRGSAGSFADAKVRGDDLAMCGTILAHSRDLAREVLAGTTSVEAAKAHQGAKGDLRLNFAIG